MGFIQLYKLKSTVYKKHIHRGYRGYGVCSVEYVKKITKIKIFMEVVESKTTDWIGQVKKHVTKDHEFVQITIKDIKT